MALIKCPECRREVSDKAPTCPHCGYQLKKQTFYSYQNRPQRLYEKEYDRKYKGMVVAGIICLIGGFSFLLFLANSEVKSNVALRGYIITSFVAFSIIGIIALLVGIRRLNE